MAPTKSKTKPPSPSRPQLRPHKLPRLPKNTRIHKRPLLHPPIPSPYTSSALPKIIYISSTTPIISAIKRTRKLLAEIDKRAGIGAGLTLSSSSNTKSRGGSGNDKIGQLEAQIEQAAAAKKRKRENGDGEEEVVIKGAGRAVERCLQIGLKLMGEGDLRVGFRTGSVGAVDDLVVDEEAEGEDGEQEGEVEDLPEVPEARVRQVSFVEVVVGLK